MEETTLNNIYRAFIKRPGRGLLKTPLSPYDWETSGPPRGQEENNVIHDRITNLCQYVHVLPEVSRMARLLERFTEDTLPRLEALGIQALRKAYDTRENSERRFEVHGHTIDLMLALGGSEVVHLCDPAELRPAQMLPNGADGQKLDGLPRGSAVRLKAGEFLAIMPGEAHMVAGHPEGQPAHIDKLVIKLVPDRENADQCPCLSDCARHGSCRQCVVWHRSPDNDLPACLKPKGRLLIDKALARGEG